MSNNSHDCEQEADKHGRIVPECEGCYNRAYAEGRHAGGVASINSVTKSVGRLVRIRYDPLTFIDKVEALNAWETGRAIMDVVKLVLDELDKEINDRYEEVTRLP